MNGIFWAFGAGTVVLAGLMTYGVTRRYGWGAAVLLPVAALAAMIGMTWQRQGLDVSGGIDLVRQTLVFAAPILIGSVVGIALAWRRRA